MTTRRAQRFIEAALTASLAIYATVPAATKWELQELVATNDSASATALLKIRIGGKTWWEETIPINTSIRRQFFTIAIAGENIQAQATTTTTLFVSGIEVTPV